MSETHEKITCKYKYSEDYNPTYINGVIGGVNPQLEIIMHFYLERTPLPKTEIMEINNDNLLVPKYEYTPSDLNNSFLRMIESGVVINLSTAKQIHEWLGENISRLESLKKNNNDTH